MYQPPNLLIASAGEIAERFIHKAELLDRIGQTEDAKTYRKIGLNLMKKARTR